MARKRRGRRMKRLMLKVSPKLYAALQAIDPKNPEKAAVKILEEFVFTIPVSDLTALIAKDCCDKKAAEDEQVEENSQAEEQGQE